jgi:hypothetical protein
MAVVILSGDRKASAAGQNCGGKHQHDIQPLEHDVHGGGKARPKSSRGILRFQAGL